MNSPVADCTMEKQHHDSNPRWSCFQRECFVMSAPINKSRATTKGKTIFFRNFVCPPGGRREHQRMSGYLQLLLVPPGLGGNFKAAFTEHKSRRQQTSEGIVTGRHTHKQCHLQWPRHSIFVHGRNHQLLLKPMAMASAQTRDSKTHQHAVS